MTTTEPPDDSYPPGWTPRWAPKDNRPDLTEAELWLGSLSPTELQATLLRARSGGRPICTTLIL